MEQWIVWLVIIILLTMIEVTSLNLTTIWFVASGIVVMILSFFICDVAIESTIFAILGIILLLVTRPIVAKLKSKDNAKTNLDRIIGEDAIVTQDITKNTVGEVKIDGKRWSAISKNKCLIGDTVKVLKIDGVKLIVEKEED